MVLQILPGASENPPLETTGTNYPPYSNNKNMLQVVATGAYYPLVATTGAYFAQNGEVRV